MARILTLAFLFLAYAALAPTYPSSVMESNNIIVAPKFFWMKSVTNDVAFSNAVNVGNGEVVKFSDSSGGGASVTLQAGSIKLE